MSPNPSPDSQPPSEPLEQQVFGGGPAGLLPQDRLSLAAYALLGGTLVGLVALVVAVGGLGGRALWLVAVAGVLLMLLVFQVLGRIRQRSRESLPEVIVTNPGLRYRSQAATVFVPWDEVQGIFRAPAGFHDGICLVGQSSSFPLTNLPPADQQALEQLVQQHNVPSGLARRVGSATLVTNGRGGSKEAETEHGLLWLAPCALFFMSAGTVAFQVAPGTLTVERDQEADELTVSSAGGRYRLRFPTPTARERWYTELTT